MPQKTIKKKTNKPRQTRRYRRKTPAAVPAVPATAAAAENHHRFVSSVTFDGKTLVTKTQKDNEPVTKKIYTMNQLEQELPIGKELIDEYLDGNIPSGLHRHTHMKPMFNNVLVHPADLGLLAPKDDDADADADAGINRRLTQRALRRRRRGRGLRLRPRASPRNLFDLP